MSEFEKWFKTTEAYKMLEEQNYFKMDLFFFVGARNQYRHSGVQVAYLTWQHQQAIIDDLKAQLNNMEACYIQVKKERDELHSATDKASTHVKRQTECFRDLKTDATDIQTKNWWQAKVQILNPIRRMLEAALRGASD